MTPLWLGPRQRRGTGPQAWRNRPRPRRCCSPERCRPAQRRFAQCVSYGAVRAVSHDGRAGWAQGAGGASGVRRPQAAAAPLRPHAPRAQSDPRTCLTRRRTGRQRAVGRPPEGQQRLVSCATVVAAELRRPRHIGVVAEHGARDGLESHGGHVWEDRGAGTECIGGVAGLGGRLPGLVLVEPRLHRAALCLLRLTLVPSLRARHTSRRPLRSSGRQVRQAEGARAVGWQGWRPHEECPSRMTASPGESWRVGEQKACVDPMPPPVRRRQTAFPGRKSARPAHAGVDALCREARVRTRRVRYLEVGVPPAGAVGAAYLAELSLICSYFAGGARLRRARARARTWVR